MPSSHDDDADEQDAPTECENCGAPLDEPGGTCSECGWSVATQEAMTSPPASGRLEHAAYVPPNLTWPSMAPIAKGSPIIEYWPSASTGPCRYAGACEDGCGHLFIRATPQDAAEAITKRDGHGAAYCAQATRSRKEPKVVGEPAPPAAIVEVVVAPRVPEARPARKGRRSA